MLASLLALEAPKVLDLTVRHVLLALFLSVLLALTCHAIYNRYFHALHMFPGPFWGSISDFHNTYQFGTRQVHVEQLKIHEAYGSCQKSHAGQYPSSRLTSFLGPVVRVSPNLLSISDPRLLPEIYHRHSEKTAFYTPGMAGEEHPLLQIQGHSEHTAKLKVLSPTVGLQLVLCGRFYN